MKSKKKVSIEIVLLLLLFLSVLEVAFFILLKAGASSCVVSAFNSFSRSIISQYSYILDMVNDLSLAYIMSYVFYAVVLLPERRKQHSINKYVGIYLANLSYLINDIVIVSGNFTTAGTKVLASSPNLTSAVRADTGRVDFLTYREHFIKFYKKFNDEYQQLSHYIAFLDDELRDCLYEVITCNFLALINDLLVNAKSNELDHVFEQHFDYTEIEAIDAKLKRFF